jgi:hypothetical protein
VLMEPMKETKILSLVSSLTNLSCTSSHDLGYISRNFVYHALVTRRMSMNRQGFICISFVLVMNHIYPHTAHTHTHTHILSVLWLLSLSYRMMYYLLALTVLIYPTIFFLTPVVEFTANPFRSTVKLC